MEENVAIARHDAKGRLLIPLMVFETTSRFYFQGENLSKEEILSSKNSGIGIKPDDGLSKLLQGRGFRDYDFNKNRVRIVQKYFPSPIADSWWINYEYWITDSLMMDGEWVYQIDVEPRSATDAAFTGKLWITRSDNAIKKLDLTTTANANINYMEYIRIQQESVRLQDGTWMPSYTAYELSAHNISKNFPGIVIRFISKTSDFVINESKALSFFKEDIAYHNSEEVENEAYWQAQREVPGFAASDSSQVAKDSLKAAPADIHQLIDTLKTINRIKAYSTAFRIGVQGFYETKYIDWGHYLNTYAWNNVEATGSALASAPRALRTPTSCSRPGWHTARETNARNTTYNSTWCPATGGALRALAFAAARIWNPSFRSPMKTTSISIFGLSTAGATSCGATHIIMQKIAFGSKVRCSKT
ncbi:MAG: hypothetical protein HC842_09975 [Cytophagales bacterium]|nr:hypothetical protein [Cytophagales bacterium]